MSTPRIVSLIASATEIVHALDMGAYQVGRSHECDYPKEVRRLPVCTRPWIDVDANAQEIDRQVKARVARAESIYELHEDILALLRPTHILTQTQCAVCAVPRQDVERAMAKRFMGEPAVVSLEPNSLNDIWNDIRRVGDALGVTRAADLLIYGANQRMKEIARRARMAGVAPLRVVCVEWPEPLMAAGNWMPELVEMLGAQNLFGEAGRHSPWMTWRQLVDADPDVVIVAPCGFDLARSRTEMFWLDRHPEWRSLRAVAHGRVYVADGNRYFHRPGPRVADSLQMLAEMLYPEVFPPVLAGEAWAVHGPGRS